MPQPYGNGCKEPRTTGLLRPEISIESDLGERFAYRHDGAHWREEVAGIDLALGIGFWGLGTNWTILLTYTEAFDPLAAEVPTLAWLSHPELVGILRGA